MKSRSLLILCIACLLAGPASARLVRTMAELNDAIAHASPGDVITMANGEWKGAKIVFLANGKEGQPVTINAETPGKVELTGNSSIQFAGDYLVIDGLHLTNGYAEAAAIEFRRTDKLLANHCRLTRCAIDHFSKPDRFNTDSWIVFWGRNNRIDHCTIGDKLNGGTTLIVELNDERSQQNYHSIDSNYFMVHSPLGSNGGETIRVGVSRYSLTSSNTLITHNYFERCSGEVEIISVKSCYNQVIGNTFVECEGGVVLRHGNHNLVKGNLFIGNNKPYTGGIRVINPNQTVTENLLVNCAGVRFRSALGVLNGVPHSQLNRYFQVKDSRIGHNSFIGCASIVFGAGKDNERTLPPQNVLFDHNFISTDRGTLYTDLNNDGGIIFRDNAFNKNASGRAAKIAGFSATPTHRVNWHGLSFVYPSQPGAGADLGQVDFVEKAMTGAPWLVTSSNSFTHGSRIEVPAEKSRDLPKIIARARDNDTIVLTSGGRYEVEAMMMVSRPLVIMAATKAELVNAAEKSLPSFISIENGGRLTVRNIAFNSAFRSFGDVQSAVISSRKSMTEHYALQMDHCEFYSFNESNYACFRASKNTFADSVVFNDCLFRNMSGMAIDLSAEKDDKGIYNAENVVIRNCVFNNILAGAINVYRGGNDESTTGPSVTIDHCVFNDLENREQGCVIKLHGVQFARVTNSIFSNCGRGGRTIWFEELSWDDVKVDYCDFYEAGRIETFGGKVAGPHNLHLKPLFVNSEANRFEQAAGSPLSGRASDKADIGLRTK